MRILSLFITILLLVTVCIVSSSATATSSFTLENFAKSLLESITPENINENEDNELGYTRLHKASFYGRLDVARELVQTHGAKVDLVSNGSAEIIRTPLMLAADRGHFDVVKFLMEEGKAEPEFLDNRQQSALWHAASNGHVDIVKYLLVETAHTRKAEANTENFKRLSPLLEACRTGAADVVEYLVNFDKTDIDFRDVFGHTCLHLAALGENKTLLASPFPKRFDHLRVAKIILGKKSNMVDTIDSTDQTALFQAVQSGFSLDLVKFLVEQSPERVNSKNGEGKTPLHVAAEKGHLGIVSFLVNDCLKNDLEKIDQVLDNEGKSPFTLAVQNDHVNVMDFLFSKGADISRKDVHTYDAFLLAALHTQLAAAQRLIIWNPEFINSKDQYGHTASHLAAYQGTSVPMMKFLQFYSGGKHLRQGRDGDRQFPIHFAAISRGEEIINVLRYMTQELTKEEGGSDELADLMDAYGKTAVDVARAGAETNLKKPAILKFFLEDLKKDGRGCPRRKAAMDQQQKKVEEEEAAKKMNADL